jgi:hypothetical protein
LFNDLELTANELGVVEQQSFPSLPAFLLQSAQPQLRFWHHRIHPMAS